jgi:hypothetical protein
MNSEETGWALLSTTFAAMTTANQKTLFRLGCMAVLRLFRWSDGDVLWDLSSARRLEATDFEKGPVRFA